MEEYIIDKKNRIKVSNDYFVLIKANKEQIFYYKNLKKILFLKPIHIIDFIVKTIFGPSPPVDELYNRIVIYDNKYMSIAILFNKKLDVNVLTSIILQLNNKISKFSGDAKL